MNGSQVRHCTKPNEQNKQFPNFFFFFFPEQQPPTPTAAQLFPAALLGAPNWEGQKSVCTLSLSLEAATHKFAQRTGPVSRSQFFLSGVFFFLKAAPTLSNLMF
jgi:hypothetical protein